MGGRDGAKRPEDRGGEGRDRRRRGAQAGPPGSGPEGSPGSGPAPEFSRLRRVSALPPNGERVRARAEAEERRALALRFDVPDVRRLEVDAEVRPAGGGWRVSGVARARLVQTCVLTLEPVVQELEERFSRLLEPGAPPPDIVDLDPDEAEDPPEPLGETLDPAEMAAEAIALAIDPYPRAPEADFEGLAAAPAGVGPIEETTEKPFASLAALRDKLGGAAQADAEDAEDDAEDDGAEDDGAEAGAPPRGKDA